MRQGCAECRSDAHRQSVLGIAIVVGNLQAVGTGCIFNANRRAARSTERVILIEHRTVGIENDLEGKGAAVGIMRHILILHDKLIAIVVVVDLAATARIQIVPEPGNQVVRIVGAGNRIVGVVSAIAAEGQIAIGGDFDAALIAAIEGEGEWQGNF